MQPYDNTTALSTTEKNKNVTYFDSHSYRNYKYFSLQFEIVKYRCSARWPSG